MSRLWEKTVGNDWENSLDAPNLSKRLSSCPKMSQDVPKCPLQTHCFPNGLVSPTSFFFPLFFLPFPPLFLHFSRAPCPSSMWGSNVAYIWISMLICLDLARMGQGLSRKMLPLVNKEGWCSQIHRKHKNARFRSALTVWSLPWITGYWPGSPTRTAAQMPGPAYVCRAQRTSKLWARRAQLSTQLI